MKEKWIQEAHIKSGALHQQLGYTRDALLPEGLLHEIQSAKIGTHVRGHTVTPLLKHRVNFALNVRK